MPRLHWCWRAAIAVACGTCCGQVYFFVANHIQMSTMGTPAGLVYRVQPYGLLSGLGVLGFLLCTAVGVWVYAVVNRRFGPSGFDNETRCRKCGYILRGVTEPRCSECGERI